MGAIAARSMAMARVADCKVEWVTGSLPVVLVGRFEFLWQVSGSGSLKRREIATIPAFVAGRIPDSPVR